MFLCMYLYILRYSALFYHTQFDSTHFTLLCFAVYSSLPKQKRTAFVALNSATMSGVTDGARPGVTDHQRAEARAYVELLRNQRENPLPIVEQLQREQPENNVLLEIVASYINFSSSRLESLIPM
jgi:hypothetical protein